MGYEFTQDYIIDYLVSVFTSYPELAKILASDPTLSLDEAIEIAKKIEKHFEMSASPAEREYVEQGSASGETLILMLFVYLLNELEKAERVSTREFIASNLKAHSVEVERSMKRHSD